MVRWLVVISFFLASPAFAVDACSATGCTSKIKKLIVDSGGVWIQPSVTPSAVDCRPDSGIYVRLPLTHAAYDSLYAALLVAKSQGQTVTLRINNGTDPCTVSYIAIED